MGRQLIAGVLVPPLPQPGQGATRADPDDEDFGEQGLGWYTPEEFKEIAEARTIA